MEFVRSMRGRTAPSLLRGDDGKYYVVKCSTRCGQPRALANEMLAGRLGAILCLPVCEPVLVQVAPRLIAGPSGIMESAGSSTIAFGSAFPDPPKQVLVTDFLPERILRRVANATEAFLGAFVFDLWTCNCSKREAIFSRPAGQEGAPYFVRLIDHDACFNDGDWKLPNVPVRCTYTQRSVYETARYADSFEPFLSRIENLKAREIENAARGVPPEWCGSNPGDIYDLADQLFRRRKQIRQVTITALQALAH